MKDVEKLVDSNGVVMQIVDGAARDMIAAEYDETESYAVGDYCIYNDYYYKCNTAIPSGGETWDATHWDATTLGAEDKEIKSSLSDYIKIKSIVVQKANLNINMDLSSYVSTDSGYKFLCWLMSGASNGWITTMPIYISAPDDVKGRPFWHPSLTIGGAVNFYYLEIKNV